ncbi:MAG: hypothetical protein ABSA14_13945 [Acidimicrobiales bacterium]|jgi:hypothetical protein
MAFDEPPVTEDQLRDLLQRVGDVVTLLRHADADERREFYQDLGLRLAYQRLREQEKIRATLGVEFSPVGGGLSHIRHARRSGIWPLD